MIKELEKIDDILAHFEDFLHGEDGNDCTEARVIISNLQKQVKNNVALADVSNLLPCPFCGGKVEEEKANG